MSNYQGNIIRKNPATPTGPSTYGSASGMWSLNEVAYWIKQGVWPNPAIVPDIYFPYVSLLLSTTSLGNANNNLFVDSSGAFNPVSRFGNTTQGSFTPYATNWSNYFDASGDYERISSSQTALQFGTGDFTVEGWVYSTGATGTYQQILTGGTSWTSGSGGVYWYYNGGSPYIGAAWNQIATNPAVNSGTLAINTWHHFAVVRSGNTLILYVNGTSVDTLDVTGVSIAVNNQSQTNIGGGGWDQDFGGYLSNLRVVKGTAVYTANFTVPTSPLTAISGTSLLTCQSNRFRDASTNNFTITVAGNTSVTDFGPFSPSTYAPIAYNQSDITNWSGYFDGTGDYLTVPTNAAFGMGTGDFTIECWVNPSAYTGTGNVLIDMRSGSEPSTRPDLEYNSSGTLVYRVNGSTVITGSTLPLNTWSHVALARSGTTTKLFLNGAQVGSSYTDSNNYGASAACRIGADDDGSPNAYVNGYMSNVRVVKGTAVYTSNFTPPTTNLTAISGTSLLTLQNAAFTDNSTNNFVITQFGNVTVNGNNPFQAGYYSNYITPGNFLVTPSNAKFQFGTGDFTVEAWVNLTAYDASYTNVYSSSRNEVDSGGVALLISSTGALRIFSYVSNAYVATGGTVPLNQWVHVAMARQGTTLRLFLNGALSASASNSQDFLGFAEGGGIGGWGGANAGSFTGYISNVRIVKGTAVYTAAFTPPTSPLTVISGTSLLACAARAYYIDLSNNFSVGVVSAVPPTNAYNPFYTATIASNGGSMYFDGNGDYLQVPTNASLQFGTSDFTVEFWMNLIARDSSGTAVFNNYNSFTTGALGFFAGHASASSTVYQVAVNGTFPAISSTQTIVYNSWNHFAIVRNGNTLTLYINGVANGTFSMSGITINGVGSNWWLGSAQDAPSNYELNGYLANFRVSKFAVYTAAFTPPTAPLTPSANTTLLVNGMNAGIYDATTINDLETVGNAQVTTAVSKFGGSSVYFDGSGDYLVSRGNTILLGSGNFTVEFWVYFNAVNNSTVKYLYDFRTASATSASFLAQEANNTWTYWNGAGSSVTTGLSGSTFATGQWYHVAITRSSNVLYCFVNGTKVSSDPADSSNYASATMTLGARYSGSEGLNGYIDDVRLTAGVARYTSNFTPPTQAFPVY